MKQLQWLGGGANPELSQSPSQTPMFEWTAFDMNLGSCVNDIKSKACCPYGYNGRQWPEGAIRGWDLLSEPTAEVEKWSHPDLRKLNMVASLVSFTSAQYQRSAGPLSGQLLQRIVPSAIPLLKGPVPWVGVRLGGNVLGGRTWSRLQEPRAPWWETLCRQLAWRSRWPRDRRFPPGNASARLTWHTGAAANAVAKGTCSLDMQAHLWRPPYSRPGQPGCHFGPILCSPVYHSPIMTSTWKARPWKLS